MEHMLKLHRHKHNWEADMKKATAIPAKEDWVACILAGTTPPSCPSILPYEAQLVSEEDVTVSRIVAEGEEDDGSDVVDNHLYVVEKVVGKRVLENGEIEYKVQWVGGDISWTLKQETFQAAIDDYERSIKVPFVLVACAA